MNSDKLTLAEAVAHSGIHPKTFQRLDRAGKLVAGRTNTDRRWYDKADLDAYFGIRRAPAADRVPVVYCRVSSKAQKPDLANQKRVLGEFCAARGLVDVQWVEEIGGGLNMERPRFLEVMDKIERREASHLVLAHKDRLARFGFDWFARFAKTHGCELLILNNETLSPEPEMVEDLMTIVHCFSRRLPSLRGLTKKLEAVLAAEQAAA